MGEVVQGGLLLVGAGMCAVSIRSRGRVRLGLQAFLVGAMLVALMVTGSVWIEAGTAAGLLAVAAGSATVLERELRQSASAQAAAERAAHRRAALLVAASSITDLSVEDAAGESLRVLRRLGFDGAAAGVVRDGLIVLIRQDNLGEIPAPLSVDEGVSGRTVRTARTVVVDDYRVDPDRMPDRGPIGAMVCTPIRANERVVGVLIGARIDPGMPSVEDVEVIEVVAGHLGAVFANRQQVEHQRLLLDRMDRLDAMRTDFVDQVSDELRDPLTVVRGAGHTLRVHGPRLSTAARVALIDRLCDQANDLREIVDALLDFSRFQAAHRDSQVIAMSLRTLLGPVLGRVQLRTSDPAAMTGMLDVHVVVDPELFRHGLALLVEDREAVVTIEATAAQVSLAFGITGADHQPLTESLIAQLVFEAGGMMLRTDPPTITLPLAGAAAGLTA